MAIPPVSPLGVFLVVWCAVAFGAGAVLDRVRVPYRKLMLIRVASILGAVLLLLGAWLFSGRSPGLFFGVGGLSIVVLLNVYCVRVCPHCARTVWPRYELALGHCPRCGTDLSCPPERIATWRRAA